MSRKNKGRETVKKKRDKKRVRNCEKMEWKKVVSQEGFFSEVAKRCSSFSFCSEREKIGLEERKVVVFVKKEKKKHGFLSKKVGCFDVAWANAMW